MGEPKTKGEIREKLRSRRAGILESEFLSRSSSITRALQQQQEYAAARTIHCYVSMNDRREVNTHPLIAAIIEEGRDLVVPVTHFGEGTLSHYTLTSFDELKPNKWGVLEPEDGIERTSQEFELVIVPMVGGDERGHRLGYGGGFYDRFLKEVQCPAVGLCFEQNIISLLPIESYDIPMNKIITEERIIPAV